MFMTESSAQVERLDMSMLLRDLAWTIHRGVPVIAGIEPVPMTELAILKHILDAPGITVGELSKSLGLRQSNASAALRTLTERGLVTREMDPDDRRVSRLFLTERAKAEQAAIGNAWVGPIRDVLAALPPEQIAAIEAAATALKALDRSLQAKQSAQ